MHKTSPQIKKGFLPFAVLVLIMPSTLVAQVQTKHVKILEIQREYQNGLMEIGQAVSQQYDILFEQHETHDLHEGHEKCLTPALMFLYKHEDMLDDAQKTRFKYESEKRQLATDRSSEQSYISPSGKFEIFYTTTGTDSVSTVDDNDNGVPDYIDRVAESADSSYRHEVINLGFTDPIPEGESYRVYVEDNLPGGAYGYATPSSNSPGGTFIVIEADFNNFPENSHPEGNQVGAIFVTMAHEFKHAIQYAQNRWQSPSGAFNWSEMDATLMEEVVYDDVNDYYNYIKSSFNSGRPDSRSIFYDPADGTPGAYYHVSWMIFYAEYFGAEIWQEVWHEIELENDLSIDDALRRILPSKGTNFGDTFVQNHQWHYASGPRAGNSSYGFGEKEFYPIANVAENYSGLPDEGIQIPSISRLAAHYYDVTPSSSDDGLVNAAVNFDTTQVGLGLILYLKNGEMAEFFDSGDNKPQVYIPTEIRWRDVDSLGVIVSNHSNSVVSRNLSVEFGTLANKIDITDPKYNYIPENLRIYQNYPNPFNLSTTIQFDLTVASEIEITVFNITGRKVQTIANGIYQLGEHRVPFDASGLSSGIYLYRLKINDQIFTKKMTLIK